MHHFYKRTLIYGQILSLESLLSVSCVTNSPMYGADWGSEDLFQRTLMKRTLGQRTFWEVDAKYIVSTHCNWSEFGKNGFLLQKKNSKNVDSAAFAFLCSKNHSKIKTK